MSDKTHLVFTCAHTDPQVGNERFDWLGQLIFDIKPDLVVNLGDFWDMRSLNQYDTGKAQALMTQSYSADIEQGLDALERMWRPYKRSKKKRPYRVGLMGNHEHRIIRAIEKDPRLANGDGEYGISLSHLETDYWFDEYHPYNNSAPALVDYHGITYGHYVCSGPYGNALGGKHHAASLVEKLSCSVTVGHSHELHFYRKALSRPYPIQGLVAGNFKGAKEDWAGQSNEAWTAGVAIKRYVDHGDYDLQWISMESLRKEYG